MSGTKTPRANGTLNPLLANGTIVYVAAGKDAATFTDKLCILNDGIDFDYGTFETKQDECLEGEVFNSIGKKNYDTVTKTSIWTAMDGGLAQKTIHDANTATNYDNKIVSFQGQLTNSTDGVKKGSTLTFNALITGYKVLAQKDGLVTFEFSYTPVSDPVEVAAEV